MPLARVQNFSISLDGFATGEGLGLDAPFGHAGERLHEWMFATRSGREMFGQPGGSGGIDDAFARMFAPGIGAEIMGAGKFGPPRWHEDPTWKGWWGANPPFHLPAHGRRVDHEHPQMQGCGRRDVLDGTWTSQFACQVAVVRKEVLRNATPQVFDQRHIGRVLRSSGRFDGRRAASLLG